MRIRIMQIPRDTCIDGLRLRKFVPGHEYEVGTMLGAVMLCEGWAVPVDDPQPALVIPLRELDPSDADGPPSKESGELI